MTDHLFRQLAPISDAAWSQIDDEATRTLRHFLSARSLVDFTGPKGWSLAADPVGTVRAMAPPLLEGVVANLRDSQPLMEVRAPFELATVELESVDRGGTNPDLSPLIEAARLAALAEDTAVFNGYAPAGIEGIAPASVHDSLEISDDYDAYPGVVARAVDTLRRNGVGGPYGIALGPRCYTGVIETTEHGGYPVLEHMKLILGGPVVWTPAVDGAVVLSLRGGDFEILCGQDFSIGYRTHIAESVELYLEESFTLRVREPRAAVALRYP